MIGAILKRDILAHPLVTIRCFGWRVFLKALAANHHQTFLSLLVEAEVFEGAPVAVPEVVGQCVELELRAKRIYETLAQRFSEPEPVGQFFQTLARQEQDHAELLGLCRAAAGREGWDEAHFDPWRHAVPGLQRQMQEAEAWMVSIERLSDAWRFVIQIESSEVNPVYLAIVAASDSEFVRTLDAFQKAGREHIAYICRRIPEFEPQLSEVCQRLREAYDGEVQKK